MVTELIPIGEPLTEKVLFKIRLATGAVEIRVAGPGSVITTREFRPRRLTIYVDAENIITGGGFWG